ncbi:CPBP family intramembrane metalloprotease [Sphingorhabdus pulchriflava]|uniref:CPBP family intramembrane metalloprotease n=1 Tax=Sphingorhabdus pulchriflava TaxID=2292257 RepID=A0A371B4H5_9SPHN|nr:type II CAAX endopeptidase family protein [Sphingorhabdus pulchriflava]RDV02444.1 CPBP family intramembrane metalloprotease [Sphingorhabdus pulchriflava]
MNGQASTTPLWLRILQFPPVKLLLLGGMLFYCIGFSNLFMSENKGATLPSTVAAVAMIALAMAIYFGFARWVERREVSELALPGMVKEMGVGILIGSGLYTGCMLILMAMGIYRMDGFNPVSFLVPAIASALSSGFLEELLFRGALFRIVEEWLGSWISIIISSAVFGLVHLANPDATLIGALFISVEAGLLLAAAYMVTRRLWMSIGFHVSWNYTQSAVFGGIVSGGIAEPGLIKPILNGPDLLTGGQFGLEASLTAFLLCTTTGVILLVMAVRKGNIVPPFWQKSSS